jgi:hypothetical protein
MIEREGRSTRLPKEQEITGTDAGNPAGCIGAPGKDRSDKAGLEKLNVLDQIWSLRAGNLICNFVICLSQSAIALHGIFE